MRTELREELRGRLPARWAHLPISPKGYPVPWFVTWFDGVPDFRVVDTAKFGPAVNRKLCWLCGEALGRHLAFVAGPMCGINRTSSEPPCHRECAEAAAQLCPFLILPRSIRRRSGIDEGVVTGAMIEHPEYHLDRNPGVAMVWVTASYKPFRADAKKILFQMGEATDVIWYAQGRPAQRAEVMDSVWTGLPFLRQLCDTPDAHAELDRMTDLFMKWMPK